jgi:hypothetical protein
VDEAAKRTTVSMECHERSARTGHDLRVVRSDGRGDDGGARARMTPAIEPGEEETLFGAAFDLEPFSRDGRTACFLLRRRTSDG